MKALAIAATDLRRLVRWRANIFFLFVLPLLIILLLGSVYGGAQTARIGVIARDRGALAGQFTHALAARPSIRLVTYQSAGALQQAVARGEVDAGLLIPADYDLRVREGQTATLGFFARPSSIAQQLRPTTQSVAADQSVEIAAAQVLAQQDGVPFASALARARAAAARARKVSVAVTASDGGVYRPASGRFQHGASTQLILFIFLTSMTGAAFVIETRRLGIARRVLSTPTSTRTIVTGQLLGRLSVALVQALIIVIGSMLFFGVTWGDPLGTSAVILSFCLVGTGVAMLVATLCSSEQQAQPIAFLLGLGLAALGGSMAPLEIFPPTARTIAHVTPHAWANDAFSKLLDHGGGLTTVLPQVGVLLAFAAAATAIAVWQLRRVLTT
jgi:linearmycin/streptolysin S transport system permease protein